MKRQVATALLVVTPDSHIGHRGRRRPHHPRQGVANADKATRSNACGGPGWTLTGPSLGA